MSRIEQLKKKIEDCRADLLKHEVYQKLQDIEDLNFFMEQHVFAVWDFMSLLKALQREINCVRTPWIPEYEPSVRRLINEIVLEEETDVDQEGNYISHFELYLKAMNESGAHMDEIMALLGQLKQGIDINSAISRLNVSEGVKAFCAHTFEVIKEGKLHKIAAAFTFGREDLIPDMFKQIVTRLNANSGQLNTLIYYLDRHIELDEGVHGPLSYKMIEMLCKDDDQKWQECEAVALESLQMRIQLWNGVLSVLPATV